MTSTRAFLFPTALLFFAAGCDGGGATDAGADADTGVPLCSTDVDCADGVFCNGVERCMHTLGADVHGCFPPAVTACATAQTCDEVARTCTTDCARGGDADGDGHAATTCGGDDCDDAHASVHPGATEICDSAGNDEDCDPTTLGGPTDSDRDGDGHVSNNCCNGPPDHAMCGDDCADGYAAIHPGAPETCNMMDDDCNGRVDDGGSRTYHVDGDHDGYGDATMSMPGACTAPTGLTLDGADCDDARADVHPGATELCDGSDENCNTADDDGCPAGPITLTSGATGPMPVGSGTIFFHDVCAAGEVLVGLATATDAGGAPTRGGALCAALTVASDVATMPYTLSAALGATHALPEHGAVATTTPATCAAHEAATSIGPGLVLGCGALSIAGHAGAFTLDTATNAESVGPGMGEPIGMTFHCPNGSVGIGVAGYEVSGTFAITGMTCASVALQMVPAPD